MPDSLSTVPKVVDVTCYGGDTLVITVTPEAGLTDGLVWAAQVKADRMSNVADATFVITPPAVSGGPAYLKLSAADTARLAATVTQSFKGSWDCQVSAAGSDPVTTLVQGAFTVHTDVTRLP